MMAFSPQYFGKPGLGSRGSAALLLVLLAGQPHTAPARAQAYPDPTPAAAQARALDWEPTVLEADRARVERMAAELTPWGQVDFSARLDPSLRVRDYTGGGEGPEASSRFTLSAHVDFADRPSTHARALQTLERARHGVRLAKLRGVLDALLAHGYLLIAQERVRDANRELEEAMHELARQPSEQSSEQPLDGAEQLRSRLERDEAQLSLEEARLQHREALQDLSEARAEAADYSLPAAARYEKTRFALPSPGSTDYSDSHEYRMLRLGLAEAEAELGEATRAPLDDLRLRGAYRARSGTVDVEGGLINGTPALELGLNTTGGPERWELEVSAQFVVDKSTGELASLQQAVSWARQELESFPRVFQRESEFALTSVQLSEEALTLAEEDVRIHAGRLATTVAALPEGVTQESAYADIGARPELARAQDRLSAARLRMYRAWIAYVRSVGSFLELSGGQWRLAAPSE